MRKALLVALVAAAVVAALLLPARAAAPVAVDEDAVVFAAGGTPVSNGVFFPGTAMCDNSGCTGSPLMLPRGANVRFVNLDPAAVANAHQIVSIKTNKRTGRPLFKSESVEGPGETVMVTSHLKPGEYPFLCSVHFGMYGLLEVTKN